MTHGKERCAGTAEGWPANPGGGGYEGRTSSWGQGKEASSSNKWQHHHQILFPVKPQFQTKTQNIHLKGTFHTSSPTALLPARQDHITAAPCAGSAVFLQIAVEGYSYPRALRLRLFCWLILWPRGLLACQPVVFILRSSLAQNLCIFTETKKPKQNKKTGLEGTS